MSDEQRVNADEAEQEKAAQQMYDLEPQDEAAVKGGIYKVVVNSE